MIVRDKLLGRLRDIRKRAGLSAKELSLKLDRAEDYIYRVEAGRFAPAVKDLECIVTLCGSSLEELFYEDFESYHVDKEIFEKFKTLNAQGKDAFLTLLVLLYRQIEVEKKDNKKGEVK